MIVNQTKVCITCNVFLTVLADDTISLNIFVEVFPVQNRQHFVMLCLCLTADQIIRPARVRAQNHQLEHVLQVERMFVDPALAAEVRRLNARDDYLGVLKYLCALMTQYIVVDNVVADIMESLWRPPFGAACLELLAEC
jgi:hypothetical protein